VIDATIVGSGPNGLAAAVTLAHAGLKVRVLEREDRIGGGTRTEELTLPGFLNDVCSAVHPAALQSPFFRAWGLTERVPFHIPDVSYAHPLDDGPAALAWRDVDRTAAELGEDGKAWRALFGPLVARLDGVASLTGGPLLRIPQDPIGSLKFGLRALEQATTAWNVRFSGQQGPALLSGVAAHGIARMPSLASSGAGLTLALQAHGRGWGFPIGGSQSIADALAADLRAHGGTIETGVDVKSRADLEPSTVTLLDTGPEFLQRFTELPPRYLRALRRYRRGAAVAKVDFALSAPVPWKDDRVALSPTVHLGGTREQIAAAENAVQDGRVPEEPYVLVTQPSLFDTTRAPAGKHTLWTYAHVPRNSELDATEAITRQIERFAPGFRDVILASNSMNARQVAANNANDIGGEMMGGAVSLWQLVKRPVVSVHPWRTPATGVYLASASTPPGPAVHGMAGWYAAQLALRDHFGIRDAPFADPDEAL
jgi:phytoene dehydrogenase-like protein